MLYINQILLILFWVFCIKKTQAQGICFFISLQQGCRIPRIKVLKGGGMICGKLGGK